MFLRKRCARAGGRGGEGAKRAVRKSRKTCSALRFWADRKQCSAQNARIARPRKTLNLIPPRKGDWIERQKCRAQKARFARLQKAQLNFQNEF